MIREMWRESVESDGATLGDLQESLQLKMFSYRKEGTAWCKGSLFAFISRGKADLSGAKKGCGQNLGLSFEREMMSACIRENSG